MVKRTVICIILMLLTLLSGCSKADTAVQSATNDTKAVDTKINVEAGLNQTNDKNKESDSPDKGNQDVAVGQNTNSNTQAVSDKGNIEKQLNIANDRIMQLESEVKGNSVYTKELEKEIELINSIIKDFTYEQQLSIAKKQWHYNIRIDDKHISGSTVEVDKANFTVSLSEGHDTLPLVPVEVFNNGRISGNTTEYIKFNNYKPASIQEPAGGFTWGLVYEFKNVPHGTSIEMEISKELQGRIGIDTNNIIIKIK